MLIVRVTNELLDRLGPPAAAEELASTTLLGDGYATVWFWRPQVALLVSEVTLLLVLMPLVPAATLLRRFGRQLELAGGAGRPGGVHRRRAAGDGRLRLGKFSADEVTFSVEFDILLAVEIGAHGPEGQRTIHYRARIAVARGVRDGAA